LPLAAPRLSLSVPLLTLPRLRTGRGSILWNCQLPLLNALSYWRQHSKWPDLDLALTRKPNASSK